VRDRAVLMAVGLAFASAVVAAARSPACGSSSSQPRNRYWCRQHPPPRTVHSSRPDKDSWCRSRRGRLSHRPAGRCPQCLAAGSEDRQGQHLPGHRSLGQRVEAHTRSEVGQFDIVKHRAALAGLEAEELSAHGLRSGYLTEAANRGIPLPEAMGQSRHRSIQQASSYYNNATRRSSKAALLLS
jgi:hypothetical protein